MRERFFRWKMVKKQYQLALKTVENHLSVREVERLVKELLKPKKAKKKADPERDMEVFFQGCGREAERGYGNEGFDQPQG